MRPGKMAFAALVLWSRFGFRGINWKAWRAITVYPRLGIAYNRIRKNATVTTIYLLREIETGEVETKLSGKKRPRKFTSTTYSEIWSLRQSRFMVIVRNPYSRLLSAFLDKSRRETHKDVLGEFRLTPDGFEAFTIWLMDGGLSQDKHWDLQTKHMFLPVSAFDAVVRFENLKSELIAFLDGQGLAAPQGRLDHLYPSDVRIEKKTSADAKLNTFYTPRAIEIVAKLYAEDFRALGYSMVFPGGRDGAETAGDAPGAPLPR